MEPISFTIGITPRRMADPATSIMAKGGATMSVSLHGVIPVSKLLAIIRKQVFILYRPQPEDADYKAALVSAMRRHVPPAPLPGALRLEAYFVFAWRKGDSAAFKSAVTQPKDTHPDYDNLCKALGDAMQVAGFFANDSQISTAVIRKRWGARDLLHVRITPDEGGKAPQGLFDVGESDATHEERS